MGIRFNQDHGNPQKPVEVELQLKARRNAQPAGRGWKSLAIWAVLFLLIWIAASLNPDEPADLMSGEARVVDGDSLTINGQRVRLAGIDAPELLQNCQVGGAAIACGHQARDELRRLIGKQQVQCHIDGRDRYDRLLGRCHAGTSDLNQAMVQSGWALAYGDYKSAQMAAHLARTGLWAYEFQRPQDWRKQHANDGETESPNARDSLVARIWAEIRAQWRNFIDQLSEE